MKSIEDITRELLLSIGEDPERDGLKDTPSRVAKAYGQLLGGYGRSLEKEITLFDNEDQYSDIIYSGDISFTSMCEHHLLPFFGMAHIAYIPKQKVIGLSKLARAVDIYARRLQMQERITMQVADKLDELLQPAGVIVMLTSTHLCTMARGVMQQNSSMKTITARGCFQNDKILYDRFLQLIPRI